jgi:nitrate/nitrite transporter NarK
MGLIAVTLFAALLPAESETATLAQRTEALRQIILLFSAMTCGAGLLIWLALPKRESPQQDRQPQLTLSGITRVLSMPSVWLQAAIILCAYTGFKAIDYFSLYAYDVVGLNELDAAQAGVASLWVRPFAAIGAGYLADRIGAVPMLTSSFVMLAAGSLVMASGFIGAGMVWIFLLTIVCSSIGIFALRGLYYAIMQDGKVPMAFTGCAVGFVSFIGYTPDAFMGPLMGYLLDQSPGAVGQQHVFWVVSGFALVGLAASCLFFRVSQAAGYPCPLPDDG